MEDVPAWYWALVDEARRRSKGWIPEPPDVVRMDELEHIEAAQAQAAHARETRRQRRAALAAALQRAT